MLKWLIFLNFDAYMKHSVSRIYHYMALVVIALLITACASIGRPEGGPRDVDPPVFVRSTPKPGAKNVTSSRIDIFFDENVQLDDPSSKIVVSPAQKQMPSIQAQGRRVTVELRDTMLPNTTYTIDFSDAINDLNEKNILDGFAMDFSTGDTIDTLRISGVLLEARTLEPAQGVLVGAYRNLSDSAVSTLPMERVARTNQLGQFTLRNLKAGEYRVYAVNDLNRDYHWDRSEDIAFFDAVVSPSVEAISVTDTLRGAGGVDSLVTRGGVRYLPNDVLLTWFNEGYRPQYLSDYKRPERTKVTINFAAPSDTFPVLTIADGPLKGVDLAERSVLRRSATRDTLVYWITDSMVYRQDSLLVAARYLRTDTLDNLTWTTDTLKFNFRQAKKKKKKDDADTVPKIEFLAFTPGSSVQDVHRPMMFSASQPLSCIDSSAVHLEIRVDTVWRPLKSSVLEVDSLDPMLYRCDFKWEPGAKYRIRIDSAAITSVYGRWNRPVEHEFTVKKMEDYANLFFRINDLDTAKAVVELLNSSDAVVATSHVVDGLASFRFLAPNTYYARLFLDANGNGKWDTGLMSDRRQPEEVYYYPRKVAVKANWDVEQPWSVYDLPLDVQKPLDIKKNKPKLKSGDPGYGRNRDGEDEEDEDGFYNDGNFHGTTNNRYDNSRRGNAFRNSGGLRNASSR